MCGLRLYVIFIAMSEEFDIKDFIDAEEIKPVRVMQGEGGSRKPKKANKYRKKVKLLGFAVFLLMIMLGVAGLGFLKMKKDRDALREEMGILRAENEKRPDESELDALIEAARAEGLVMGREGLKDEIRAKLEVPEASSADLLRELFSEYVFYVAEKTYHFVPINTELPRNTVEKENIVFSEDGFADYIKDGKKASMRVVDVSQFQKKNIDWNAVKAAGIDGCMIRVGFRGYGSGAMVEDECFQTNIKNAQAAGMKIGVYFFTQAINEAEAVEEAEYVLERIAGADISLPVALDVEVPDPTARANDMDAGKRTDVAKAFLDKIADAGYTPMIYANTYGIFGMLDVERIYTYPIWFAFYNTYTYYPYELKMWQYTENATVDGIDGNVDMNLWFE